MKDAERAVALKKRSMGEIRAFFNNGGICSYGQGSHKGESVYSNIKRLFRENPSQTLSRDFIFKKLEQDFNKDEIKNVLDSMINIELIEKSPGMYSWRES